MHDRPKWQMQMQCLLPLPKEALSKLHIVLNRLRRNECLQAALCVAAEAQRNQELLEQLDAFVYASIGPQVTENLREPCTVSSWQLIFFGTCRACQFDRQLLVGAVADLCVAWCNRPPSRPSTSTVHVSRAANFRRQPLQHEHITLQRKVIFLVLSAGGRTALNADAEQTRSSDDQFRATTIRRGMVSTSRTVKKCDAVAAMKDRV